MKASKQTKENILPPLFPFSQADESSQALLIHLFSPMFLVGILIIQERLWIYACKYFI